MSQNLLSKTYVLCDAIYMTDILALKMSYVRTWTMDLSKNYVKNSVKGSETVKLLLQLFYLKYFTGVYVSFLCYASTLTALLDNSLLHWDRFLLSITRFYYMATVVLFSLLK